MDSKTKGAWVVHHGRKIAADVRGAADYSAIDIAAKSAGLLSRLSESKETILTPEQVVAAARVGNLNPKTELISCLEQLQSRKLIDRSADGSVAVLGVTGASALNHAAGLFEDNEPQSAERAAISLAELTSASPVQLPEAVSFVSDNFKIASREAKELIDQATQIGFVDAEGADADRLLFNGNLFRRDNAIKTKRVLDSLSSREQRALVELDALLKKSGSVLMAEVTRILGEDLLSKAKAAALYDMNIVSNEAGDHVFITSPGSFHKFSDPIAEDAFDHAKALVAALSYGMSLSAHDRGRIWGIELLLGKLIAGRSVGPATAIGNDYKALELERVVKTERQGYGFTMTLLKREVGVIALEVLRGRDGSASALETLPSAGMRSYTPPETARSRFRKSQSKQSKQQTQSLLDAVRGGGQL